MLLLCLMSLVQYNFHSKIYRLIRGFNWGSLAIATLLFKKAFDQQGISVLVGIIFVPILVKILLDQLIIDTRTEDSFTIDEITKCV